MPKPKATECGRMPAVASSTPLRFAATCIERIFFAVEVTTEDSFWLQMMVAFAGRLDEEILCRCIHLTLEAEPYLRARLVEGLWQPSWRTSTKLEPSEFFEFCPTNEVDGMLERVLACPLDTNRGCGLKVYLVRGAADTLCLKLDHKIGDGRALKDYAGWLADTYSRVVKEPDYAPHANNTPHDRFLTQITRRMSRRDRRTMFNSLYASPAPKVDLAEWRLPPPPEADVKLPRVGLLRKQVPPEGRDLIAVYARRHGASTNSVCLAACALAAVRSFPRSSGEQSEIFLTVDLRRYLPQRTMEVPCCFTGFHRVRICGRPSDVLEDFVAEVREQMDAARQGYIGLEHRLLRWELDWRRRLLFNCIPFRTLKRITQRRRERPKGDRFPNRLVFSNVGEVPAEEVMFSNVKADNVWMSGAPVMRKDAIVACLTEFRRTLNVCVAFSPHSIDRRCIASFLETFVRCLPQ